MAKTNQSAPYAPGSTRGKVASGNSNPFASQLQAGRNTNPTRIPARSGRSAGTKGAFGPGGDLKGGKSPKGRPLSIPKS